MYVERIKKKPISKKLGMDTILYCGNCLEILPTLPANSVDSVVTDPPYHLTSIVERFGADNAAPTKGPPVYKRHASGFMGQKWDGGDIAFRPEMWAEVLRVLKPGGHLLAFGGTRTYHMMAYAVQMAGFEVRDCISWNFGSGFPKSHNISKNIDKLKGKKRKIIGKTKAKGGDNLNRATRTGNDKIDAKGCGAYGVGTKQIDIEIPVTEATSEEAKQWEGWGTALKPAMELIVLARKPLSEKTVAQNVLKHGTGGLNIDGCRVDFVNEADLLETTNKNQHTDFNSGARDNKIFGKDKRPRPNYGRPLRIIDPKETNNTVYLGRVTDSKGFKGGSKAVGTTNLGRWPANLIHDGSEEVVNNFPNAGGGYGTESRAEGTGIYGKFSGSTKGKLIGFGDSGSAARFFYTAKADKQDRLDSKHPTIKPVDLMRYLVRLITPKGGTVLDPFAGTGVTAIAAYREGMQSILIEREEEYQQNIINRSRKRWGTSSLFTHLDN